MAAASPTLTSRGVVLWRGAALAAALGAAGAAALGALEPAAGMAVLGVGALVMGRTRAVNGLADPGLTLLRAIAARATAAERLEGTIAAALEQLALGTGASATVAIVRRSESGLCDATSWADGRVVTEELLWQPELAASTSDGGSVVPRLPPRLGRPRRWLSQPLIARGEVCGALLVVEPPGDVRPWLGTALTVMGAQIGALVVGERFSERLERGYVATIEALIGALEAKDPYTAGHSGRVAQYAMAIAQELGVAEELLSDLQTGAILHDIGKIGVGDGVLFKAGRLTDTEFDQIKDHPRRGARIIDAFNRSQTVLSVVFHHHERYDGRGYPAGLRGVDIPLVARIVNVADAYDAMTTNRPYNSTRSRDEALAELRRGAGTQFDPQVVDALDRAFARGAI